MSACFRMTNTASTMSSMVISQTSVTHAHCETLSTPYTDCGHRKHASTWSMTVMLLASNSTLMSRYMARNGSDTKIA